MERIRYIFWNDQQRRLRAPWRLLATALLFTLLTLLVSMAVGLIAALWLSQAGISPEAVHPAMLIERFSTPGIQIASTVLSLLTILAVMWAAARLIDRRSFASFGFHLDRGWWADLGFGLALGALLMTIIFLVERAAGWVTIARRLETPERFQPFALALVPPLTAFLGIGIREELMARGYLLQNLAEGLNLPALKTRGALVSAWVLSSVLFGLAHAANPNATIMSTFNLVLAGLFLGLGYVLTGELAVPIGLHITWNFFQGVVFGFPVSGIVSSTKLISATQRGPDLWTGGAFGPEAGLIGVCAMLGGSLLILAWVRWRWGRIALQDAVAQAPGALVAARETD